MSKRINWLHLSDLHYGQKNQNILLPRLKKELFKDIALLKDDLGKVDIVFFTGDLTFSGKKEEYDSLSVFLKELWSVFDQLGTQPLLVAIPGNHDLQRPELRDPVVKVLRRYNQDQETQEEFWNDLVSTDYYKLIQNCFGNFTNWYNEIALPKPTLTTGLIPGDVATTIKIDGASLKIVGLNTAFLELASDDYLGKLAIHPLQLQAVTGADPLTWIEDSDISLLLTHHDSKWYDPSSTAYYEADIYPPGTFFNHLCGHLHEPSMTEYGLIGSPKRRLQLAPSLFGLEKVNNVESRIHGYIAGSYTINETEITEQIYPRIAVKMRGTENYQIAPDYTFPLNTKAYIEVLHAISKSRNQISEENAATDDEIEPPTELKDDKANILQLEKRDYESDLEQVPRAIYTKLPQHQKIRLIEQEDFVNSILNNRYCWLITDWSLAEEEFIGTVCERLNVENKNNFIINCEDVVSEDDIFDAFKTQTGINFTEFCDMINTLDSHFLVFNQVHVSLYRNLASFRKLERIIKSITAFCHNTYVILIARQAPNISYDKNVVKLTPLDGPQIKTYIVSHPNSEDYLTIPENLDKLTHLSGGLPYKIDRFMNNLKYASFQELLEIERGKSEGVDIDTIPKALQETLSYFSETTNKLKLRSLKLLKILTILSYGETYHNLKRFISNEPISIDQIAELEGMSLVEVTTKNRVLNHVDDPNDNYHIKLFRVPKQVRDVINSMITENEKDEILKNGCNLYFGNKWREGSIKSIQSFNLKSPTRFLNIDNCQLIVRSLLFEAINNESELEIERSAILAVNYCEHILKIKDYKNAQTTAEEIYNLLKNTSLYSLTANIAKVLGKALRMSGNRERAVQVLQEAIDTEEHQFSNVEKNSILTDQAYAYLQMNNNDKAIECAKQIEKTSSPASGHGVTAKYIIAQATLSGEELLSKLRTLERAANKAHYNVLANNISINIADTFSDQEDRNRRFTKVLTDSADEYNTIRAVVNKALDTMEKGNGEINHEDLQLLNMSYSYLYSQRMVSLFDNCHKALWLFCIKNKFFPELLNLFRYSSFFWRISDQEHKEKIYFDSILAKYEDDVKSIAASQQNQLSISYLTRRKLELGTSKLLS
ncbi:hypothetical protein SAMN04488511_102298 [Pedobacter suwonensis]|uniref:Calcineurin-like phosphoesterase domain-containing protein n=1 Tax=Pedobacter suwonensis TaxID=332999 RepID=A0A1I0SP95_9SPHI|nr:metallophosphoesterase [Pedobacter suwonensis]SFA41319.1 hypothetical protein SAMN04488511_102298 [Pedobacter suwonensis]